MEKKLHKSSTDKAIAGVCGGIAEYFGIDSVIVRLLFVLLSLGAGSGLLIYIICAIVMPDERRAAERAGYTDYNSADYSNANYTNTDYTSTEYTSYTSSDSGEYTSSENFSTGTDNYGSYNAGGYDSGNYDGGESRNQRKPLSQRQNLGVVLIALAALILLKYFIPRIPDAIMFAGVLLLGGLYLLFRKR